MSPASRISKHAVAETMIEALLHDVAGLLDRSLVPAAWRNRGTRLIGHTYALLGGIMATILSLILAAVSAFALLTYGFFWYETANSPYRNRLRELSNGHPGRLMLRGILSSILSLLTVVFCFPLQFWRGLWQPPHAPNPERPPVFLVHGLYHNASAWVLYRWWLKRAGFNDVYAFSYNSLTEVFEQIHSRFDQWVEAILAERHPDQQAIMIGHSLGGLIIRAHVSTPDAARRVAAVVALGTPHGGSKLAVMGVGKLAQSLVYRGALSQRLEQLPPPEPVKRLAVYSPIDNMVLPPDALRSAQPGWELLETPPISHVSLLYHGPTARRVLAYVKGVP
jgi:triacylglycerol lipase